MAIALDLVGRFRSPLVEVADGQAARRRAALVSWHGRFERLDTLSL
jgi:hypothetical protein